MIITLVGNNKRADYDVNPKLVIQDALAIMCEDVEFIGDEPLKFVRSKRLNKVVNVLYTFEAAGICNGDTIKVGE